MARTNSSQLSCSCSSDMADFYFEVVVVVDKSSHTIGEINNVVIDPLSCERIVRHINDEANLLRTAGNSRHRVVFFHHLHSPLNIKNTASIVFSYTIVIPYHRNAPQSGTTIRPVKILNSSCIVYFRIVVTIALHTNEAIMARTNPCFLPNSSWLYQPRTRPPPKDSKSEVSIILYSITVEVEVQPFIGFTHLEVSR